MKQQSPTVRLDKFLSSAGIVSRRRVTQFLKENTVIVDGKRLTEAGIRIHTKQQVLINNKKVNKPGYVYFLLNKPIGIISSTADEFARDTVTTLIDTTERIYPVGRLDKDSHGLIILTNNGELTHQLIHPRYHVPKTYRITVAGHPTPQQLDMLTTGVLLSDGIALPAEVIVRKKTPNKTTFDITLHEGRNRQIRRMCEKVRIELLDLQRIAFGPIKLGTLPIGDYRMLTKQEVEALQASIKEKTNQSNNKS